jgi:hypothetical protein
VQDIERAAEGPVDDEFNVLMNGALHSEAVRAFEDPVGYFLAAQLSGKKKRRWISWRVFIHPCYQRQEKHGQWRRWYGKGKRDNNQFGEFLIILDTLLLVLLRLPGRSHPCLSVSALDRTCSSQSNI